MGAVRRGGPLVSTAHPASTQLVGITPKAGVTGEQDVRAARTSVYQHDTESV